MKINPVDAVGTLPPMSGYVHWDVVKEVATETDWFISDKIGVPLEGNVDFRAIY